MIEPVRRLLADGREILYFNDRHPGDPHLDNRHPSSRSGGNPAPAVPAAPADTRTLPGRPVPGELRYDALTDEWVALAAHRQERTHLPPADQCPLCPSRPDAATEIPATAYDVAVLENRFPSFGPDASVPGAPAVAGSGEAGLREAGLGAAGLGEAGSVQRPAGTNPAMEPAGTYGAWGAVMPASGRCEVVAFTSAHRGSFAGLGRRRARTVIDAWAQRTAELSAMAGVSQVFCFENRGEQIGVTLHHPHGQIYAYPYVTPRTRIMLDVAERHHRAHGTHLLADVLAAERADGRRMLYDGEHWSAFVPIAARWPVEVHLLPHRRVPDFAGLDDAERDELATAYPAILAMVERLYPDPTPYIAAWHQAPVADRRALGYLHLQLTSPRRAEHKLKYLAGSEAAMGAFISDVAPERTAALLRGGR